jgi:hypothetical protein
MDLVKHIKSERVQKKIKQPFRRALFHRISGLVKEYALGESLQLDRVRVKEHFEPPLFSLSFEEQYRVTMAIMNTVNNAYLHFVNSPDEILLCRPLFSCNPSLGPDKLARYHFETLLLQELGKQDGGDAETPNLKQDGEK